MDAEIEIVLGMVKAGRTIINHHDPKDVLCMDDSFTVDGEMVDGAIERALMAIADGEHDNLFMWVFAGDKQQALMLRL